MTRKFAALAFGSFLLVSCTFKQGLAVEEVLKRAATASQNLQSADFTGEGDIAYGAETRNTWHIKAQGTLQDGGKETRMLLDLQGNIGDGTQSYAINAQVEIIAEANRDTYVNLHSFQSTPEYPGFRDAVAQEFAGKWWKLPQGEQADDSVGSPGTELEFAL